METSGRFDSDLKSDGTSCFFYMTNVLFVAHGKLHARHNPGYKMLKNKFFRSHRSTYIDIDPRCQPTHIIDATENHQSFFGHKKFDHIFVMYAHYSVLESMCFWHNIASWLKPGGMIYTIIPRFMYMYKNDYDWGLSISSKTRLLLMNKSKYVNKKCQAIVMFKKYEKNLI